ncbi:hypothetical protein Sru01_61040 [Sphaerisporangium rufum]|uniref:Uncharacterized protein n=1 Tax=Sphaerisporangium rufum TaxID=1381558 RepID=A0A919R7J6_9ACTN|nr:hypothetical protein [Sphaerisporangium rufum]GII81122.1 hypothetical protein Sru01_61040 [Sphaerisporangium rufum]
MREMIHLIVRPSLDGAEFYATSPQAPGLLYGRPDLDRLRADLPETLGFYFDHPGPFQVQEHHEHHHELRGGELVVRTALDKHLAARRATGDALSAAAKDADQADALPAAPAGKTGEVVYICGVLSDTVGWVANQLDPRGDAATVAVSVADLMIVTVPFVHDPATVHGGVVRIAARPYARDTRLADLVRALKIVSPATVTRLSACA